MYGYKYTRGCESTIASSAPAALLGLAWQDCSSWQHRQHDGSVKLAVQKYNMSKSPTSSTGNQLKYHFLHGFVMISGHVCGFVAGNPRNVGSAIPGLNCWMRDVRWAPLCSSIDNVVLRFLIQTPKRRLETLSCCCCSWRQVAASSIIGAPGGF